MREIKFRAWDSFDKRMIKDKWQCLRLMLVVRPERYIQMQYTGLKDKNGKEIYEGDIVIHNYFHENFEIKYEAPKFRFINKFNDKGQEVFKIDEEWLEIIGNIHQNSELLNKE